MLFVIGYGHEVWLGEASGANWLVEDLTRVQGASIWIRFDLAEDGELGPISVGALMAQARLGFTQFSSSSVLKVLPLSATQRTYKRGCVCTARQPQHVLWK
jgi:hypothetical protein